MRVQGRLIAEDRDARIALVEEVPEPLRRLSVGVHWAEDVKTPAEGVEP
jgi:hypothetical protein